MKKKYKYNERYLDLSDQALCKQFNRFLKFIEDEFRFNFLGYCNGLSGLYVIYTVYGKSNEWFKDLNLIAKSSHTHFRSYHYQILFYRVMLNILQFQQGFIAANGKERNQLHLQNSEIITALDFIEIENLSDYDQWEDTTLERLFLEQTEDKVIRLYSHLGTALEEYIEISWDAEKLGYKVSADALYFFDDHIKLLIFIEQKAPVFFNCSSKSRMIAALHEKKALAVHLADSAYLLLDNHTFSIQSILKVIEPDTGVLLASILHTIALYKKPDGTYLVYTNGEGVPIQLDAELIEYNINRDKSLAGHANISLFRRFEQKPLSQKLLLNVLSTLEQNKEYIIGKYENYDVSSKDFEDCIDDEESTAQGFQEMESLIFFCITNNFESVLYWYLQQFSATSLSKLKHYLPDLAEAGYSHVVKFLLANNIDMHNTNEKGEDALYLAYLYEHINIVDLLLQNDADFFSTNIDNDNVCFLALTRKDPVMLLKLFHLFIEKKLCSTLIDQYVSDVFSFAQNNQIEPLMQVVDRVKHIRLPMAGINGMFQGNLLVNELDPKMQPGNKLQGPGGV